MARWFMVVVFESDLKYYWKVHSRKENWAKSGQKTGIPAELSVVLGLPDVLFDSGTCVLVPRTLAIDWEKKRKRENGLLSIGNR